MFLVKLCGIIGIVVSFSVLINHLTSRPEAPIVATSLSQVKGMVGEYRENTVGGLPQNRRHLVADISENQEWWETTYKTRFYPRNYIDAKSQSSHFWKVSKGYGDDQYSLNRVCSQAYALRFVEVEIYRDWIKSDLELYCTVSGQYNTLNFGKEE